MWLGAGARASFFIPEIKLQITILNITNSKQHILWRVGDWRHRPGRPRACWTDKLRNDTGCYRVLKKQKNKITFINLK